METTPSSINRIKTAELLRTKGTLTGNFGKAKVKAGSTLADLGNSSREHIGNLPTQDEYLRRLQEALGKTDDHRLARFIQSEIRRLSTKSIQSINRVHNPQGAYCDLSSRRAFAGR